MVRNAHRFIVLLACVVAGNTVSAAPRTSEDNVKFTVKADNPEKGKQVITLTMEVAKGWHLYANPVGHPDFTSVQTTVSFVSGGKPVTAKVVYPEGKLVRDPPLGNYKTYEGTVTIKATIESPTAGEVEATVLIQTCTDKVCMPPSKVKLNIE